MFPTLPILFHPITIPTHRSAPHNLTCKARLVIVAGPALQPTPPFSLPSPIDTRPQSPTLLRPGLPLWQVPPSVLSVIPPPSAHPNGPACHCGRSRHVPNTPNPLPSHLYTQSPVNPTQPPMYGPACHCGWSRLTTNTPFSLPSPLYTRPQSPPLLRPGLSLWQVPPSVLSVISPPSAHLNGPACHCGRSRHVPNTPNPLPSHLYTQSPVNPTFPHI